MGTKGDLFDGMIYFKSLGEDPKKFGDYPERVVGTLRMFYKTFNLPEGMIPSRKNKSVFEEWIIQLDELNKLAPNSSKMQKAMTLAKEMYDKGQRKFMIGRPASIRLLLANAVMRINNEEKRIAENLAENKKAEVVDNDKKVVSSVNFRKLK